MKTKQLSRSRDAISRMAARCAAVGLMLTMLLMAQAGAATTIVEHAGANDPTTEGFLSNGVTSSNAVYDDLGLGIDAWHAVGSWCCHWYIYSFTSTDISTLTSADWEFTARFRNLSTISNTSTSPQRGTHALVSVGGVRFDLSLRADAVGNQVLSVNTFAGSPSYTITGLGTDYVALRLLYNHATATADVFVDGTLVISDYAGHTSNTGTWVIFGGEEGNFNSVKLEGNVSTDTDGDGVNDDADNCPDHQNADQADLDEDDVGDVCDDDADGDGDLAGNDCADLDPTIYTGAIEICTDNVDNNCNGQVDEQLEGADCDGDGYPNELDNCPLDTNKSQEDLDGDGLGDVCDEDIDGDGVLNDLDNCPSAANSGQADLDGDGAGDVCDADADGDGLDDANGDMCPGSAANDPVAGVPSRGLGKNRWADMDGNEEFDTGGNNPTGRKFTIFETAGCNCAQIMELCGYGDGHTKFGCSNSVMDAWTGKYDYEGQAAFQCKDE